MNGAIFPTFVVAILWTHSSFGAGPKSEPLPPGGDPGPVIHYTFETSNGQVVANEVGREHTGQGHKASVATSLSNERTLFVRKNTVQSGYFETADHDDLNAGAFTVAGWIKLRREDSNGSVVCKHDWYNGAARGYVLRCNTSECINFTIGASGWKGADGTTRVPANQWVHVAGTFNGKQSRVYFNGRLEGTTEIEQEYTPSPYPLRVGHAAYALDKHRKFDGQIDDVMIWNRTLTPEQLHAVYEAQKESRPRPLTKEDVAGLIQKLGSEKFKERVIAQRRLIELDTEILPLLEPHRQSGDPEIAWRLNQIEKAIGTTGDE